MKKIIYLILTITLIVYTFLNYDTFVDYLTKYLSSNDAILPDEISVYEKDYSLSYAKNVDDFTPYSTQDLVDILYTAINRGYESFTFYCPDEYQLCISDIDNLSKDINTLTHINNFVHPYNSFTSIQMSISDLGEINVIIDYLYEDDEINEINKEVDELILKLINDTQTDEEKILIIHDYIIDNTNYDISFNKNETTIYNSSTAYGALFEGYAICNGYTDLMAIFLSKLNIKNIKVATTPEEVSYSNTGHVWNAVYISDEWLHLDLTWDDPVSDNGQNYLYHTYFLISSSELYAQDNNKDTIYEEHNFNKQIYYELQ